MKKLYQISLNHDKSQLGNLLVKTLLEREKAFCYNRENKQDPIKDDSSLIAWMTALSALSALSASLHNVRTNKDMFIPLKWLYHTHRVYWFHFSTG